MDTDSNAVQRLYCGSQNLTFINRFIRPLSESMVESLKFKLEHTRWIKLLNTGVAAHWAYKEENKGYSPEKEHLELLIS